MSVIKEKKKSKPFGLKKVFLRLLVAAVSGLFFGLVMVGVLYYYKEDIKALLRSGGEQTIIIGGSSENDNQTGGTSTPIVGDTDVQAWKMSLYQKGEDFQGAIVEIGDNKESDGVIFSTEGDHIIILAADCPATSEVKVRFCDGWIALGEVAGRDGSTGLAVVFVEKKTVKPITLMEIKSVRWGDTTNLKAGQYIIAIGRPNGEKDSVIVGTVSETGKTVTLIDREHQLLVTDIASRQEASGFFIDEKGKLLGVITHIADQKGNVNWITAYGISGISEVIELLANRKPIPYLGIDGTTVTDDMNQQYGVPDGIYVNRTETDSPAMQGNVQAGDVIVAADGVNVGSMYDLQQILLDKAPDSYMELTLYRLINGQYTQMTLQVSVGKNKIESR